MVEAVIWRERRQGGQGCFRQQRSIHRSSFPGPICQDGAKILFETVLKVTEPRRELAIPHSANDADQFNYLAGRDMEFVNDCAFREPFAPMFRGCPNIIIRLGDLSAQSLGYLFYFMEKACAISACLGVNPLISQGGGVKICLPSWANPEQSKGATANGP